MSVPGWWPPRPRPSRGAQWLLLWLAIGSVLFFRSSSVLLLPDLRVEDGRDVFAHFYMNPHPAELFRFKAGYIPLVPNIVGWVATRFPPPVAIYLLAWVPLGMAVLTYGLFFHRRFAAVVPGRGVRAMACVLLAVVPFAQYHLYAHTDYSIWTCLLALVLLTALRLPRRGRLPWVLGINVLVWAHPLTIVVAPAVAWHLWRDVRARWWYAVMLLNLVVHQLGGVAPSGSGFEGTAAGYVAGLGWLVRDVVCRSAFGQPGLDWALERLAWLPWLVAAVLVPLSALTLRARRTRGFALHLGLLGGAILGLSLYIRGYGFLGDLGGGGRYVLLPSLFLVWSWTVLQPLGDRGRGMLLAVAVAYYGVLLVVFSGGFQTPAPANGIIVREFAWELWHEEQRLGTRRGIYLEADKVNDWDFVIDTRGRTAGR